MSTISKSLRMQMRPIDHVDTPPGQTNNVAQRPSHSGSREPAETSPGNSPVETSFGPQSWNSSTGYNLVPGNRSPSPQHGS
jgi:hypothetical protein